MIAYKKLVSKILKQGTLRPNRTGTDAISLFGCSLRHDMSAGFPLLTTKQVNFRACIYELLWFLRGDTNVKYLNDNGVHIWDPWADKNGGLGPVYGKQWVDSGAKHVNQVQACIDLIKNDPYSRRIIIDAWSPSELSDMALPPCHILYQFYADPKAKKLSLSVYMRSADMFLGVPFDIAEGALLLSLMADVTGYGPKNLVYTFGDAHIYTNHVDQIQEQLARPCYQLPMLAIGKHYDRIEDYKFEDIALVGYKHHGILKGKVAV